MQNLKFSTNIQIPKTFKFRVSSKFVFEKILICDQILLFCITVYTAKTLKPQNAAAGKRMLEMPPTFLTYNNAKVMATISVRKNITLNCKWVRQKQRLRICF